MSKDLFDETTMSFGDHLEELRACLWKALIGLVIGVIGGLFVSPWLVRTIQGPIEAELKAYYEPEKTDEKRNHIDGNDPPSFLQKVVALVARRFRSLYGEKPADKGANGEKTGDDPAAASNDGENGVKTDGEPETNDGDGDEKADEEGASGENSDDDSGPVLKDSEIILSSESLRALMKQLREKGVEFAELPEGDFELKLPVKVLVRQGEDVGEDRRRNFGTQTFSSGPAEAFLMYLKVSVIAGLVFSSPWVFYQIWSFVAAGLYPHERKYIHLFLPASLGLFLGGVFFCFYLVIPLILNYLFKFNAWLGITPFIRVSEWVSFAVMLPVMFGIGFQLPLVMFFLERINIFTVEDYWKKQRIAILIIAVASMMLTPPDPASMGCLMVPMVLLYYMGIWMVYFTRRKSPFEGEAAVP